MSSPSLLPFATIEQEFRGFDRSPGTLHVAGAVISPALPPEPLSPSELRRALLDPSTGHETRDAALGWLVGRAQDDGGCWIVVATGMLLPGLRSKTACLAKWCPSRTAELQAEVVDAVVEAILGFPPGRPGVAASLVWAGFRSGHRFATRHLTDATRCTPGDCDVPPPAGGHPDLVLRRAVSEGVIDEREAAIIGDTRLGGTRLARMAAAEGIDYQCLAKRRRRAEIRLASWLQEQVA